MKPPEALAKRIIESIEVGGRTIYREDQSVRTHDFDLYRGEGFVAAIEVTSTTDGAGRAIDAAIARRRRIPRRMCTKDWRIHPASDAMIKRIVENADAYLARIEADGIERFFSPSDGFVYILRSGSDPERRYIGIAENVDERLRWHNTGPSGYTVAHRPWSIAVSIEFSTEREARRFERYLKSGSGRAFAKRHFAPGADPRSALVWLTLSAVAEFATLNRGRRCGNCVRVKRAARDSSDFAHQGQWREWCVLDTRRNAR